MRECQDDEEKTQEIEQKKVQKESALFKRHWKAAQSRMKTAKAKEDKKRQNAFLEKVYKEQMAEQEQDEESDDMDWDPIEDVLEDNRANYLGTFSTLALKSLFPRHLGCLTNPRHYRQYSCRHSHTIFLLCHCCTIC